MADVFFMNRFFFFFFITFYERHISLTASKQTWNSYRRIHSEQLRNGVAQKTLPESNKNEKLYHPHNTQLIPIRYVIEIFI